MEEPEESSLEHITDTITDLVIGIPSPIRKNFFKAFAHLCTAAVDVPVAKLESKAAEIRAASQARILIINEEGEQISNQLKVSKEYVDKASEKFASRVVKEQLNLDQVGINAANNLKNDSFDDSEKQLSEEISDDWLNEFGNFAKLKSSDDMKMIFGKILSGEITKPGTFSIRTVRLISQIDNEVAKLFQKLCSLSISMYAGTNHVLDARVVSLNGDASSNSLSQYGLTFDNLNILHEYGLIISDYNSWIDYNTCVANEHMQVDTTFRFGNIHYGLIPTDNEKYDKILKLNGVAFTKAGKELLSIIPIEDATKYRNDLQNFFGEKYLKMLKAEFK